MSQVEGVECPICQEPMGMAGNRQVSALKCGHVFCKECIEKWLSIKEVCPQCRATAKVEDITPIYWSHGIPVDDRVLSTLKEENERLKSENSQIMSSLEAGYLSDRSQGNSSQRFPSLVIERSIQFGSRICFSPTKLILSTKRNDNFGIEFSMLTDLTNWKFVPLHSMQVRDISVNSSPLEVCCSISYDSTVAFVSLINPQPTVMHLPEIPWSCCWVSTDSIAIGSAKGTFFLINSRTQEIMQQVSIGGPPFFSLSLVDDKRIACLNSQHLYFFDLENANFSPNKTVNKASMIKKSAASNDNMFALLSLKDKKCTISSSSSHQLNPIKWCFTDELKQLARPAITTRNGETYVAIPGKEPFSFNLRKLSNLEIDIWKEYKGRWMIPESPGVVMDLSFSSEGDLYLAVVSEAFLALFLLPF